MVVECSPFSQYCSGFLTIGIKVKHVRKREGNEVFKPTFVGKAGKRNAGTARLSQPLEWTCAVVKGSESRGRMHGMSSLGPIIAEIPD